jgi:hypothetical protein
MTRSLHLRAGSMTGHMGKKLEINRTNRVVARREIDWYCETICYVPLVEETDANSEFRRILETRRRGAEFSTRG